MKNLFNIHLIIIASFAALSYDISAIETDSQQVAPIHSSAAEYIPQIIYQGKWGSGIGEFAVIPDIVPCAGPWAITSDINGNIYVLDSLNFRIMKFSNEGKLLQTINLDRKKDIADICELRNGVLIGSPNDRIEIDKEGNIYIGGSFGAGFGVLVFSKEGRFVRDLRKDLGLKSAGIEHDSSGNIYLISDDPQVANIVIDKSEHNNKILEIKVAYFKIVGSKVRKLTNKPEIRQLNITIPTDEVYKEGYQRIFNSHITHKGEIYSIFWDGNNQNDGVKIIKWLKQN